MKSGENWKLEKELGEQSRIKLSDDLGKPVRNPLNIAGGLRNDTENFLEKLPAFSRKSIVLKNYEFRVVKSVVLLK